MLVIMRHAIESAHRRRGMVARVTYTVTRQLPGQPEELMWRRQTLISNSPQSYARRRQLAQEQEVVAHHIATN